MAQAIINYQLDSASTRTVTLVDPDTGIPYKVSSGNGGTAMTDDTSFTTGASSLTPMGALFSTSNASLATGVIAAPRMSALRVMYAQLRDETDASAMDATNHAVRVNLVAGGGSGGTSATDQTAWGYGSTGLTPLGAVVAGSVANVPLGDVAAPKMSQNRVLYQIIRDGAGNERGANVNGSNQLSVSVDAMSALVAGTAYIGQITASVVGSLNVFGTVSVSNFPATQVVSGTITATIAGTVNVAAQIAAPLPVGDNGIGRTKLWDGTTVATVTPSGYLSVDLAGSLRVPTTAAFNVSTSGDNPILPAPAAGRIKIYSYLAVAAATVNIAWKSGATFISGTMAWAQNGGAAMNGMVGSPVLIATATATVSLNLGSAVSVGGHVAYYVE